MKHTQNLTERCARAEALLAEVIDAALESHAPGERGMAARGMLLGLVGRYADHKADLETLALNAQPEEAR